MFKSGCKPLGLMYSLLTESDANCRRLITALLPKTFLLCLWADRMGTERGKNKDLLFFTVTQRKCRLSTGSICRFQIFCGPLLLFLAFRSNLSPCTELDFHVLRSFTKNPTHCDTQGKVDSRTSALCSHLFMLMLIKEKCFNKKRRLKIIKINK